MNMTMTSTFIWRRIHSLMGLGLVLFVCEHLFVNLQAALWIGDDGKNFVRFVNAIQSIPYLHFVEVALIGIPILFHTIWGVQRALSARTNSWATTGAEPAIQTARNQAFTWQRLTSWILLFGIVFHGVQVRFLDYPKRAFVNGQEVALVRVSTDQGLAALADRLHVTLYSADQIAQADLSQPFKSYSLSHDQRVAAAPDRGTAMLLTVRNILKNPWMDVFYTIFVLAVVFHACNGLWTFLITWGLILTVASQKLFSKISWVLMAILAVVGLSIVWLTYWVNLR